MEAGGTNQRLNPGFAMMDSLRRSLGMDIMEMLVRGIICQIREAVRIGLRIQAVC